MMPCREGNEGGAWVRRPLTSTNTATAGHLTKCATQPKGMASSRMFSRLLVNRCSRWRASERAGSNPVQALGFLTQG